jgi:SAM-dependent methyltransferase
VALGRRAVDVNDPSVWVFNRMADAYAARPACPDELVASIAALATSGKRVGDIGAGIGHLALPLALRGLQVSAIEPARAMLECLSERARVLDVEVNALVATAEAMPLSAASLDLAVIADALHFLDAERTGCALGRVLAPAGALAIVSCELADTPFMREVARIMAEAAPRRARSIEAAACQVAALCDIRLGPALSFHDATAVEPDRLTAILRSISFIGPAMNEARWAAFRARIAAIPYPAIWARTFHLRSGRRQHAVG